MHDTQKLGLGQKCNTCITTSQHKRTTPVPPSKTPQFPQGLVQTCSIVAFIALTLKESETIKKNPLIVDQCRRTRVPTTQHVAPLALRLSFKGKVVRLCNGLALKYLCL